MAPFNIELVDMDRFKPPNSVSHEFEIEGSYPNESLDNVGRSKKEAGRRSSQTDIQMKNISLLEKDLS